jgi:hypothetical protein
MLKRIYVMVAAAAICVGTSALAQSASTSDNHAVKGSGTAVNATTSETSQTRGSQSARTLIAPVSTHALFQGANGGTCDEARREPCCPPKDKIVGPIPMCCPGEPYSPEQCRKLESE